jgi:hypothetical protein
VSSVEPLLRSSTYDSAATQTALDNFISATASANIAARAFADAAGVSPHRFKVCLHAEQAIRCNFAPGARITPFADNESVLNPINKDWDSQHQVAFPYLAPVVTMSCAAISGNNCTQYRYSRASKPAVDNIGATRFTPSESELKCSSKSAIAPVSVARPA